MDLQFKLLRTHTQSTSSLQEIHRDLETSKSCSTIFTFSGSSFICYNGRASRNRIERKLDKVLCYFILLNEWKFCKYQVPVKCCSDHTLILASLSNGATRSFSSTIKFLKLG